MGQEKMLPNRLFVIGLVGQYILYIAFWTLDF